MFGLVMSTMTTPAEMHAWGWRVPFLIAVPLGLIGLYLRLDIEDSPVYLAAARELEASRQRHAPIAEAFRLAWKQMLVLFGWVAMQSVAGYILVGFMLSRLVTVEHYPVKTALVMLIVAHVVAVLVVPGIGAWCDRTERSTFAVTLALATAVWSVPAFSFLDRGLIAATFAMSIYAVIQYSTMIVSATAVVERFPVSVRYSASALPFQLAYTLFGGTAPFVGTWLTARFSHLAPAYYIAVMGLLAAVLARFALRTKDFVPRGQDVVGCASTDASNDISI
ncbi:major Facilitator Superfamily protein [Paraburkholderia xenovorans LB400]|nr:major Facilitator Superfamily protein [Paraburkholderia xenovorans LB400]